MAIIDGGSMRRRGRVVLTAMGFAWLLTWAAWWVGSLSANRLLGAERTWVPATPNLGYDFLFNYFSCRLWLQGRNPFVEKNDWAFGGTYSYPPAVLPLFAWSNLLAPRPATAVWTVAVAALVAAGAWAAWRLRPALGLRPPPLPLALAAVLTSAPVVFAMERGNCDAVALGLILAAAWALGRRTGPRDALAGACLALAAWVKIYPGVLGLGLLVLGRPRAVVWFAVVAAAVGLADLRGGWEFLANSRQTAALNDVPWALGCAHNLIQCWKFVWTDTPFPWLSRVPGVVAGCGLVLPLVLWVSRSVRLAGATASLVYPYFLWLAAAATFLMPVAVDYNLIYLPLAVLAVWGRRDPLAAHLLMAFFLFFLQPFHMPIAASVLFLFKLTGLFAVAVSLARRAREQAAALANGPPVGDDVPVEGNETPIPTQGATTPCPPRTPERPRASAAASATSGCAT